MCILLHCTYYTEKIMSQKLGNRIVQNLCEFSDFTVFGTILYRSIDLIRWATDHALIASTGENQ